MALVRVVVTPGGVGTAEDAARAPTMGSGPAAAAENTQAIGDRGTPASAGSGRGPVTRSAAVDPLEWRPGAASGVDLRGPGRVGPVSVHAEMTPSEADSAVGLRGGHERAKADSGPAAVTPNEGVWAVDPNAEPGRASPASARASARSEVDPALGHRGAPGQVRGDSGRADVTPDAVDSEVGPREGPPGARVDSGRADVTPDEAASAVDPRGRPARARAASAREARGPDAEGGSAAGRAASEHCPAGAVHEDPAPARGVEVEVGGAVVGAEPAPASPG